jgi:hypothetical protein
MTTFAGTLDGLGGTTIVIPDLWALEFRTGGVGVNPDSLYFSAGINYRRDGLFGSLQLAPVPEPDAWLLTATGLMLAAALDQRRRRYSLGRRDLVLPLMWNPSHQQSAIEVHQV